MNKKLISVLLAAAMVITLFANCGVSASAEAGTYTYHSTYSSVST